MKKLYISLCAAIAAISLPMMASAQCTPTPVISTIAGNHTRGYSGDGGPANEAQMRSPYAIAVSATNELYIADYFNHAIRKVSGFGIITTVVGDGTAGFTGDGGPASAARLNGPAGISFDVVGNMYIADKFNERIRKVDAATGIITTVAGNGAHGGWNGAAFGNGGPATAAALTYPVATVFDPLGNMYIADNGSQTVRKIDTAGVITRFAGTHAGGYNGDGIAATAAKLNNPRGLAVDAGGNVYISDCWNNRIRKVDPSGQISTFAGTGVKGYSGDGGPATDAQIFGSWGITTDICGNLYICDYDNYVVRKVGPGGTISTYAGNHLRGYTGDGGTPDSARVYLPSSLAMTYGGAQIFIADYGNIVVRGVGGSGFGARAFTGGTTQEIHACKNSAGISIDNLMAIPDAVEGKTETWTVSVDPEFGTLSGFTTSVEAKGGMVVPKGLVYTPKKDFTGTDEFTVQMTDGTTTASTTITVYVDELPNAGALTATNVTRENSVTMSNPTGDAGGAWTSSDEKIATVDANGVVTALNNGIVTIAYTVSNNCGSKSASANVVAKVSDLQPGQVSAFPNPSTGTFRLDFASEVDQAMHLVATDVTGKVVYTADMQATAGINTWSVNLPANIQRPSLLRLSVMDASGRKLETLTVSVIK
ncbi:MAG: Ig-like domain-containing protein [Taibaiella sp.]|nr:Ig-like domain-containing protein [Taibaiella sp.]